MALFPRVTTWVSNQVLTASALNGEFNNILNNAQASSWIGFSANVSQMQQQTSPGGVGSESLAGSISDELQRLRYMLAQHSGGTYWYDSSILVTNLKASGVVTNSINNLAVTTAKINDLAVTTGKINDLAVTTAKIDALAVTTAKIADANVTPAKLASLTRVFSSNVSGFSGSSTTYDTLAETTLMSSHGRPVVVHFVPYPGGAGSYLGLDAGSADFELQVDINGGGYGAVAHWNNIPPGYHFASSIMYFDNNGGSTSVKYRLLYKVDNIAHTLTCNDCQLVAYEL